MAHDKYPECQGWQVETPGRVGKSRCYSCFLMFLCCLGDRLHDARCSHLERCHQIWKLLMWAPDMLFILSSLGSQTCQDLLTAVPMVVRGWKARTNISKLRYRHPRCHWRRKVSMLVWIARALKLIAARGLADWRRSICIGGFLRHQVTKWQMKAKVSNAARVRYRNRSTWLCRTQIGHMASLAKKSLS